MKINSASKLAMASTLCLATGLSQAQALDDWKLSLGLGATFATGYHSRVTGDIDDTDTSISIELGYQLDDKVTLTAAYHDLGDATARFNIQTTQSQLPSRLQRALDEVPVLGDGLGLGASYAFLEHEKWRIEASIGLYFWDSDVSSTANGITLSRKEDGTDIMMGVAGQYDLNGDLSGYAKLQRYALAPNSVNEFQVGVIYRF